MTLPPGFREHVVHFSWPENVTLEVVEEFRQEYACHYNLRECAMILFTILPGSFTVVWFIPLSIVECLTNKAAEHVLLKYSVTRQEIAGLIVYRKVNLFI